MNSYYVYKHTSPSNKVYIGITSQLPHNRWRNGFGYHNNHYFYRAIKKYGWDNFKHEILYTGLCKSEAEKKEMELIEKYKSSNCDFGYNLMSGSLGGVMSHSDESKKKMSNSHKNISDETRKKLSDSHKGQKISFEQRLKISESAKKVIHTDEWNKHVSESQPKKAVYQLDDNENIINEFVSMHDADKKTGVSYKLISRCCRRKTKHAGGYVWRYVNDN